MKKPQALLTLAMVSTLIAAAALANDKTSGGTQAGKLCFMGYCLVTSNNGTGWKPGMPIREATGGGNNDKQRNGAGLKPGGKPPMMAINTNTGWKPGMSIKE